MKFKIRKYSGLFMIVSLFFTSCFLVSLILFKEYIYYLYAYIIAVVFAVMGVFLKPRK